MNGALVNESLSEWASLNECRALVNKSLGE